MTASMTPAMRDHEGRPDLPGLPRLIGVLPIVFFAVTLASHARDHSAWTLLWMCNLCNLVLAAGLLLRRQWLIWVATTWLILGLPLWIWNTFLNSDFHLHSLFTHAVAPIVGLWAMRGRPAVRGTWMVATLFGAAVQGVCRAITPPELNINVSHASYKGLPDIFASYPVYATLNLIAFALALLAMEKTLARVWAAGPTATGITGRR